MSETLTPTAADAGQNRDSAREVQEGKLMALLCYIFTIVAIFPFVQRNNAFSLYHAKQSLTMLLACIAAQIALMVVGFVLSAVGLGIVSLILGLAFMVAVLGLVVIGALHLIGEDGVPSLLAEIGITANQLREPES